MPTANQNSKQIARGQIDVRLAEAGRCVQNMKNLDWAGEQGIAMHEYQMVSK